MSLWAEINSENIVIRVLVGDESMEDEGYDWLVRRLGGTWIKTDINSFGGKRVDPNNGEIVDNNHYRYNYAGEGYQWDASFGDDGAFIPPKTFPSWVIDPNTATWIPPIAMPDDGKIYYWDEDSLSWIEQE